jgi:hypothetical protein
MKPKTVLIDQDTHKMLKDYCKRIGTKVQAVADKAIQAYLRKAAR